MQAILDDPETANLPYNSPMMGAMTVGAMLNQYYLADVFMHTWDLARATGQDDRLEEDVARGFAAGMAPIEEMLRSSGQFGTARGPLREDADATDTLISFIGRDPYWTPESHV